MRTAPATSSGRGPPAPGAPLPLGATAGSRPGEGKTRPVLSERRGAQLTLPCPSACGFQAIFQGSGTVVSSLPRSNAPKCSPRCWYQHKTPSPSSRSCAFTHTGDREEKKKSKRFRLPSPHLRKTSVKRKQERRNSGSLPSFPSVFPLRGVSGGFERCPSLEWALPGAVNKKEKSDSVETPLAKRALTT